MPAGNAFPTRNPTSRSRTPTKACLTVGTKRPRPGSRTTISSISASDRLVLSLAPFAEPQGDHAEQESDDHRLYGMSSQMSGMDGAAPARMIGDTFQSRLRTAPTTKPMRKFNGLRDMPQSKGRFAPQPSNSNESRNGPVNVFDAGRGSSVRAIATSSGSPLYLMYQSRVECTRERVLSMTVGQVSGKVAGVARITR